MSLTRPAGTWPSTAWHPDGDCDCRLVGDQVVVRVNEAEVWRQTVGPVRWLHLAAKADGTIWVIGTLEVQGVDRAFLVTRSGVTNLGTSIYPMRGVRLEVVDAQFVAYLCDGPSTWMRHNLESGQIDHHDNPFPNGSVAGMRGIKNGEPLWNESPNGGMVEIEGLRFPQVIDGNVFGQLAGPDCIAACHDEPRVPTVIIPGQCYESEAIQRADGAYRVCARTDTGTAFVTCPPWPEQPSVTVPTFQPAGYPIGLALFADDSGPSVCSVEGSQPPYVSHERTPFAFSTVNGPDYAPVGTRALGAAHGIVELYYRDGLPIDPLEMPRIDSNAWAGVYSYPNVSMQTVETAARRLQSAGVPVALVVPAYCQWHTDGSYTWTEQAVVDRLKALWDLALALHITAMVGFAKRRVYDGRLVDGVDYWPAIGEAWARMRAASANWQQFPIRVGPTPNPEPPHPTPPPRYPRALIYEGHV